MEPGSGGAADRTACVGVGGEGRRRRGGLARGGGGRRGGLARGGGPLHSGQGSREAGAAPTAGLRAY